MKPCIKDTNHIVDTEILTESEDELKGWAYLMMQHILEPDLRRLRGKEATVVIDEWHSYT